MVYWVWLAEPPPNCSAGKFIVGFGRSAAVTCPAFVESRAKCWARSVGFCRRASWRASSSDTRAKGSWATAGPNASTPLSPHDEPREGRASCVHAPLSSGKTSRSEAQSRPTPRKHNSDGSDSFLVRTPPAGVRVRVLRPDGAGPHRDHGSGGPTRYPEPRIVRIKGTPPATSSFLRRLLTCTASTLKSASALL